MPSLTATNTGSSKDMADPIAKGDQLVETNEPACSAAEKAAFVIRCRLLSETLDADSLDDAPTATATATDKHNNAMSEKADVVHHPSWSRKRENTDEAKEPMKRQRLGIAKKDTPGETCESDDEDDENNDSNKTAGEKCGDGSTIASYSPARLSAGASLANLRAAVSVPPQANMINPNFAHLLHQYNHSFYHHMGHHHGVVQGYNTRRQPAQFRGTLVHEPAEPERRVGEVAHQPQIGQVDRHKRQTSETKRRTEELQSEYGQIKESFRMAMEENGVKDDMQEGLLESFDCKSLISKCTFNIDPDKEKTSSMRTAFGSTNNTDVHQYRMTHSMVGSINKLVKSNIELVDKIKDLEGDVKSLVARNKTYVARNKPSTATASSAPPPPYGGNEKEGLRKANGEQKARIKHLEEQLIISARKQGMLEEQIKSSKQETARTLKQQVNSAKRETTSAQSDENQHHSLKQRGKKQISDVTSKSVPMTTSLLPDWHNLKKAMEGNDSFTRFVMWNVKQGPLLYHKLKVEQKRKRVAISKADSKFNYKSIRLVKNMMMFAGMTELPVKPSEEEGDKAQEEWEQTIQKIGERAILEAPNFIDTDPTPHYLQDRIVPKEKHLEGGKSDDGLIALARKQKLEEQVKSSKHETARILEELTESTKQEATSPQSDERQHSSLKQRVEISDGISESVPVTTTLMPDWDSLKKEIKGTHDDCVTRFVLWNVKQGPILYQKLKVEHKRKRVKLATPDMSFYSKMKKITQNMMMFAGMSQLPVKPSEEEGDEAQTEWEKTIRQIGDRAISEAPKFMDLEPSVKTLRRNIVPREEQYVVEKDDC